MRNDRQRRRFIVLYRWKCLHLGVSFAFTADADIHRLRIYSDWFRLETVDDSLQPTVDMLLNLSVFLWLGAVCPWPMFAHNNVISIYRLIFLGILVLLFRRLPAVYAMHKYIHQI